MRVFFDRELETVATFWQVHRRDGVTLGFSSHNEDLWFAGINHMAAPGMAPAAIRLTTDLEDDSAEVEGALSHNAIRADELRIGLYDSATIAMGVVDWNSLEFRTIYRGHLGRIEDDGRGFVAELTSVKATLDDDIVPRTSPTCRAQFCGKGCTLSRQKFTSTHPISSIDLDQNTVSFPGISADLYLDGQLRFLGGPQTGMTFGIVAASPDGLILDQPLSADIEIGTSAELLEGCDHTLTTCASRFSNSVNFRGEPYLPGNDLLSRYGRSQS
ncbi:MAG: DUF2163 domain-containing protein [Erythrobacter sp.]